jgi:flagellar basal body-associated protein FliL
MEFLNKIEEFINQFLFKVGTLLKKIILKHTPEKILIFKDKLENNYLIAKAVIKNFPQKIRPGTLQIIGRIKEKIHEINFKERLQKKKEEAVLIVKTLKANRSSHLKIFVSVPMSFIKSWFAGLTPMQTVLLTTFTAASFVALINIISSGKRMASLVQPKREPAQENTLPEFDRPGYYKKEKKHVMMSNVRLPVYHENVNDLKTVDIDFNVTLSNRHTRNALEKLEFQLRDFLILKLEPQIPEFMLVDEGKEILRQKIWKEIDEFLREREINGQVIEVQITYVLAN